MALENLKSIFNEGLENFNPPSIADEVSYPTLESPEYFDMVGPPAVKLYDTYNYDPRTDVKIKNPYTGTSFEDNAGGLFNSQIRYSTAFGQINTPLGYTYSPTGNDIIEMGNILIKNH